MSYIKHKFYIFLMQLISIVKTKQKEKILEDINKKINEKLSNKFQNKILTLYKEYIIKSPLSKNKNAEKIEAIILRKSGRFWNNIIQIINTLYFAKKTGIKVIYLEWCPFFMDKRQYLIDDITISFNLWETLWKYCIIGNFFYLENKQLKEKIPTKEYLRLNKIIYENLLSKEVKKNIFPLEQDDLVIHIRSGDIFGKEYVHSGYAQPPLSYYVAVLKLSQPTRVILVYEDTGNPCIEVLQKYLSDNHIPYINFSKNVSETVSLLLHAKNICYWKGTFVPQIILLSENIKINGYTYNSSNPRIYEKFKTVYTLKEKNTDYEDNVLKAWKNTKEQKKKMIEYTEGDFEIKIIEKNISS